MVWSKPKFPRGRVDAAGRILAPINTVDNDFALVGDDEWNEALGIINNWRSAHSYPLLATRVTLTARARLIDGRAIVAQRLKRPTSFQIKLWRNPRMSLSQMHDIGGCRAVPQTASRVEGLVRIYEDVFAKNPNVRTEFVKSP